MLGAPLIWYQAVGVCQPREKRLLAPFGLRMRSPFAVPAAWATWSAKWCNRWPSANTSKTLRWRAELRTGVVLRLTGWRWPALGTAQVLEIARVQEFPLMYTSKSPSLWRGTPHAGNPAYATAEEGSGSLVNEGFTTLPESEGTRGIVVSQRDDLRQDTRSTAKGTNRRPDMEPPRRAPHPDTAAPGAPGHAATQQGEARQSWRPLRGLLRLRTFAALRHREFLLLWSGQAATSMAMWMDQVVRGWLMYELTNSPVQLGLVQGVQAIPILVLSPVAGSVADRYPRKQQVVAAQVLAGVMYVMLALLIMTGHIQPWHVYATAFGMAIVQTFHQPARAAMVADAVPPVT